MKELGCEHFRAVFDPANFVQCGQDTKYAFDNLKEYVEYMHIKDALLADGSVVPSGKGDGNVPSILKDMPGCGDMILSLEPHLTVFSGLETLQGEELKHVYSYPDSNTAFDAAACALRDILTDLNQQWK